MALQEREWCMAEIPVLRVNDRGEHLEPPPMAYSYIRFSTERQELGDSLRRQVQMAEDYAKEHGLRLSTNSFRDLGVSAFRQKNIKVGALSAFISAVKNGFIEKGSYLLIEQFDRLSRAEVTIAFRLLLDLVEAGVIVVTLVDERVWNSETVNDIANLLTSIILMSRAHEESKAKSRRLSAAWGEKKAAAAQTGKILTSECPRWLTVNADKSAFVVLQDRMESVRKVFAMRIGGYGVSSIVSRANEEKWPLPGKGDGWYTSTVGRLLKNRALLGEYQPHKKGADDGKRIPVGEPVLGYYPVVLDEATFLRAQASADRKGNFPGRRDASLKNWLQGLLKCSCGHSMVRKNKNSEAQPGYARYYCSARNRKKVTRSDGTLCAGASALELENAVLEVVSVVAPQHFEGTARTEALKARADLLEVDVSAAKQTRDHYLTAIGAVGKSKTVPGALLERYTESETALEAVEKELAAARAELADLAGDFDSVFENIRRAVASVDSLDARAALREDLSRIIEKAVVHEPDGYIQVFLRGESAPVVQRLREDATLPCASVVQQLTPPAGFVPGLPTGIAIAPLSREQQAAYLEQLERDEESER